MTSESEIIASATTIDLLTSSGIYYLIRCKKIVYIGKSSNIAARIGLHLTEGEKEFDAFYLSPCPLEELTQREIAEIIKYQPEYNAMLHANPIWKSMQGLKTALNKNANQIKKYIRQHGIKGVNIGGSEYFDIRNFGGLQE